MPPFTSAAEIVALARAAYPDALATELRGGDCVGTDAYPALRDAWPALVDALRSPAADVRIAAAYALAFVLEPAATTQPALDAAVLASELPLERAAMILAAGRLRASIALWRDGDPDYPWEGHALPDEAARERSPIVRTAMVLAMLFRAPTWQRKVHASVADVLDEGAGDLGPWGDGDLRRLARAMRELVFAQPAYVETHDANPPDDDDVPPHGDDDAPPIGDEPVDDPYTQDRPTPAAQPTVTLAGIRDIDWASLEHAYGPASGVPAMIEALASPDEGDRRWGLEALFASINHQGSIYSASGPAAPFLVQLVERTETADRPGILRLLAGLAVGDPTWRLFDDLDDAASEAFDEVSAGAPVFVRLLADPDPHVRTLAAYALSFVSPSDGASTAVKRALAMETDRYARSSLLLALGYVGRRTRSTADRAAIERYLDDECPLLAGCAALALALLDGVACSPRVRAVLARTITDAPRPTGVWPWNDGDIAGFARIVRMRILTLDEMLDEADAARVRGDAASAREYAQRAFVLAFRDGTHGVNRPWIAAELDDRHRRILRFLVAIAPHLSGAAAPQFPIDISTAHSSGIPRAVAAVERIVGDATGPLDREVVVDGRTEPAWFAIDAVAAGRAPVDPVRAAFALIAPADRIPLVDDALDGPFALWHSRAPMDFGDPASYARENDHASRFVIVIAALLGDAELVGHAHARALADAQLALDRPHALQCLVAAIVLARHARESGEPAPAIIDRLVFTDQAPATTYRIAIRAALDLLPSDRRARLLGDLPLHSYWSHRDPRGEVRRWLTERGWDLLDFLEPAARAEKILAAWHEWQRHRAAGDDIHATPVRGTTTSPHERQPGPDQEFPIARARELLVSCGDAGAAALAALSG